MKIAISIPDDVFASLEAAVADQGVSRSAFVTSAVEEKLRRLLDETLTAQVNAALDAAGPQDLSFVHDAAAARGARSDDWTW